MDTVKVMPDPEKAGKKRLGIIFLIISCILWCFTFIAVPFLPLAAAHKIAVGGTSYAIREIFFYAAIYLLGKEYAKKLLNKFKLRKSKKIENEKMLMPAAEE